MSNKSVLQKSQIIVPNQNPIKILCKKIPQKYKINKLISKVPYKYGTIRPNP